MKKHLLFSLVIIIAVFAMVETGLCQVEATPLVPEGEPNQKEFGLIIGFGQNIQNGMFYPTCKECDFRDGLGFGFTIGGMYEQEFMEDIRWGVSLIYDLRSLSSKYPISEDVNVQSTATGLYSVVPVTLQDEAKISTSYLSVLPYIKITYLDPLYFKIGPGISYVMSSSIKHTETPLQKTVVIKTTGEIGIVQADNTTLEDGTYQKSNSIIYSIDPVIGLNFQLDRNLFMGASFMYSIPLSDYSQTDPGFKISTWRLLFDMRIAIKLRKSGD